MKDNRYKIWVKTRKALILFQFPTYTTRVKKSNPTSLLNMIFSLKKAEATKISRWETSCDNLDINLHYNRRLFFEGEEDSKYNQHNK